MANLPCHCCHLLLLNTPIRMYSGFQEDFRLGFVPKSWNWCFKIKLSWSSTSRFWRALPILNNWPPFQASSRVISSRVEFSKMEKLRNSKVNPSWNFFDTFSLASKFRGLNVPPPEELRLIDGVHRRWILPDPLTFYISDDAENIRKQYKQEIRQVTTAVHSISSQLFSCMISTRMIG